MRVSILLRFRIGLVLCWVLLAYDVVRFKGYLSYHPQFTILLQVGVMDVSRAATRHDMTHVP
jgi:hypothetical protein